MEQDITPQKAKAGQPTSLSDTAPMMAASAYDTIVMRKKTAPAGSAASAANKAIHGRMTYRGKPLEVEGAAFHRLMERYRGGTLPSLRDMLPVLLFFAFQAGIALAMLVIELSR
jgi:hypothetical protein